MVITTYLEQLAASALRPSRPPAVAARIERVDEPVAEFSRFLYAAVGAGWQWVDRSAWTLEQWRDWLAPAGRETWVAWLHGAPAGYLELDAQPTDVDATDVDATDVEISYFGLLPQFIGRGLGGQLLTTGIERAWTVPDRFPEFAPVHRVWVHTCSLDGPHALANYQARGLRVYRTETSEPAATSPTSGGGGQLASQVGQQPT